MDVIARNRVMSYIVAIFIVFAERLSHITKVHIFVNTLMVFPYNLKIPYKKSQQPIIGLLR